MTAPLVRQPAVRVLVNGAEIDGVERVQVRVAGAFQAARFEVRKALAPVGETHPPGWWDSLKKARFEISATLDGQSWVPMVTGDADDIEIDFIEGVVNISGRDLAALFIDTRTTHTYRNLTASEIAEKLAAQQGLSAKVTKTSHSVGRYYRQNYDKLFGSDHARQISEWDLLCHLGQVEGIVPYVEGTTLHFEARAKNPPAVNLFMDGGDANASQLRISRSMTLAGDVHVTVKSWSSWMNGTVTATAVVKPAKAGGDKTGKPVHYYFTIPNMTHQQADATAQRLAHQISTHERRLVATIPAYLGITPAYVVSVTGLGGDFDLQYYPEDITTTIDIDHGAHTEIEAKNHPPIATFNGISGARIEVPQ